ncbi:C40 family peptidase [Pedobacter sp. PWIIR3]
MATIRVLLMLLCTIGAGRGWGADRSVVTALPGANGLLYNVHGLSPGVKRDLHRHFANRSFRVQDDNRTRHDKVLAIARSQLGVREKTGHNDGAAVEGFLNYVGFKKGNPWCAAFVSWCFWKAGYSAPRTAWSPSLFPKERLVQVGVGDSGLRRDDEKGLVIGIYFPELKRIAHCGLLERMQGDFCQSIEGNTNSQSSREGNGVYRRLRHRRTIKAFANWLE